jgi:5-methylcytosine-specific restriction endonuclease McrA
MRKTHKYIDLETRQGRNNFYNTKEWRAIRLIVLSRDIYCIECLKKGIYTVATEVDHKIDIVDRPDLCMDINNLQSYCKPCHSQKTFKSHISFQKPVFTKVNKKWKNLKIN